MKIIKDDSSRWVFKDFFGRDLEGPILVLYDIILFFFLGH